MTPKKTPTLVQLRKLAKRKGLDIEEHLRAGRYTELWWIGEMTHFASIFDSMDLPIVKAAAFGLLSALPDKGAKR